MLTRFTPDGATGLLQKMNKKINFMLYCLAVFSFINVVLLVIIIFV